MIALRHHFSGAEDEAEAWVMSEIVWVESFHWLQLK
jgi:hypothetical protein